MNRRVEIKCPYCYEWNEITEVDFTVFNIVQCADCLSIFRLSDNVIDYV